MSIIKFADHSPTRKSNIVFCLFFLFGYLLNTCLAATTLEIEPGHVQINEPFRLILTSDNPQSNQNPDLKPLQKDFIIMGTENSLSYSIINGRTTSVGQWMILLRAKSTGKLTIPALTIGQEKTEPRTIDVGDMYTSSTPDNSSPPVKENDDAILKTNVSEKNPYINQQVLYTVRLYSNQQLINAEYHPPNVSNALLIPLGDSRRYQTLLHNQTYSVAEQQYLIFPQKSGKIKIDPPSFNATVYRDFPRQMNLLSKVTTLDVRPAPNDFTGKFWLPAQNISLSESYDSLNQPLTEGTTVTRTVTLKAEAMPAQLLPNLDFETNNQFSVYPETPEIKNKVKITDLTGISTTKVTYLFDKAGQITIPELKIHWFNTSTGKAEVTALPPRSLTITPSVKPSTEANLSKPKLQIFHDPITKEAPQHSESTFLKFLLGQGPTSLIIWALVIGFGSAWVLVFLIWWLRNSRFFRQNRHRFVIKQVQKACKKNQPDLARTALLNWARLQWPERTILNLQEISQLAENPQLKKHLMVLSEVLYKTNTQSSWDGASLWQAFEAYIKLKPSSKKNKKQKHKDLPPINP